MAVSRMVVSDSARMGVESLQGGHAGGLIVGDSELESLG
jgi:hypothetical protein